MQAQGPMETRSKVLAMELVLQVRGSHQTWVLGPGLGPLKEQYMLLTEHLSTLGDSYS